MNALAPFLLGTALGASAAASAALLLYTTRGFLGTAGFLIALTLAALAFGVWTSPAEKGSRRRWIAVVFAYVAAAIFAMVWRSDEALRSGGFGGALAAFFLLAEPAYTSGAAYRTLPGGSAAAAFMGAAAGVLAAALVLIPQTEPGVIFVTAAAAAGIAALLQPRYTTPRMDGTPLSLNGKAAIVTGVGERGQVGFAVAAALVRAGARVCLTSRGPGSSELAAELGANAHAVQADLTSADDVARLIAFAQQRLGAIDILVNIAGGLSVIKPLAETTAGEWEREMQRNAETTFLVSSAALPLLRATRGSIINFASPAGLRAVPQLGAYSAAKAAVVALTRALAIEETAHGVRVNAIAPGMVDTEQNRRSAENPDTMKWVTREQIADTVLFLASAASSGITGETIHVLGDGIK